MKLWNTLRNLILGPSQLSRAPEVDVSAVTAPVVLTSEPKRGRPMSSSLLRTLDLLRNRPEVTAREIGNELGVSAAYARTLLKRARAKVTESAPPARNWEDIRARLDEAERSILVLRQTRPDVRTSWSLNKRAEVLRLAGSGTPGRDIAAALNIPGGEVEFILKIDQMLRSA